MTNFKEDVHGWFELSYAQYLTIPRSVLETMPMRWQVAFVELLKELDQTIEWRPSEGRQYFVTLEEVFDHKNNELVFDELREYRHPCEFIKKMRQKIDDYAPIKNEKK